MPCAGACAGAWPWGSASLRAQRDTAFTSPMEMTGSTRVNSRNIVKKRPKVPTKVITSTQVGEYVLQLEGRKSRCRLVTMMTKRSNHMPTLMTSESTKMAAGEVRIFLNQKNCGLTTLHVTIVQYAQA